MAKELDSGKLMYYPAAMMSATHLCMELHLYQVYSKGCNSLRPFDTFESHFVREISKTNEVIESHIWTGQNFFDYELNKWDVIVSTTFPIKENTLREHYHLINHLL